MGEPNNTEESKSLIAHRFPFRHTIDVGNSGILVAWAQAKLHEHGHYAGAIDGRYDREVSLAVRNFQKSRKLMITGVIDRKTWDAL